MMMEKCITVHGYGCMLPNTDPDYDYIREAVENGEAPTMQEYYEELLDNYPDSTIPDLIDSYFIDTLSFITEFISDMHSIPLTSVAADDGKSYILFEPDYDWHFEDRNHHFTKEDVDDIILTALGNLYGSDPERGLRYFSLVSSKEDGSKIISNTVYTARQFAEGITGRYFFNCDTKKELQDILLAEGFDFNANAFRPVDARLTGTDGCMVMVECSKEECYTDHELFFVKIPKNDVPRFLKRTEEG